MNASQGAEESQKLSHRAVFGELLPVGQKTYRRIRAVLDCFTIDNYGTFRSSHPTADQVEEERLPAT